MIFSWSCLYNSRAELPISDWWTWFPYLHVIRLRMLLMIMSFLFLQAQTTALLLLVVWIVQMKLLQLLQSLMVKMSVSTSGKILLISKNVFLLMNKTSSRHMIFSLNPLHPNINMHILHIPFQTAFMVLTRSICLTVKSCWWSFPFISWLWCVIQGWYC